MGAYSFKKQFVEHIRAGTKNHTIRANRKDGRMPQVGELLSLWCGMRTKQCFRILPGTVRCTKVQRLDIFYPDGPIVFIDSIELGRDEHERLAKADGFESWEQMKAFWSGRIPFHGHIIHWR